jgi:ATP-dependent Clp protease protease subunit
LSERDLKDRIFVLNKDVNGTSIGEMCDSILKLEADDDEDMRTVARFERKPINIYIDSFGGAVYDMWALIDIIQHSKAPVYTYSIGKTMSAGFQIFLAGEKRFVAPHATLLYHQVSSWTSGSLQEMLEDMEEVKRLQTSIEQYVKERTGITESELVSWRENKKNVFFTADDAIKRGIATEVWLKENS